MSITPRHGPAPLRVEHQDGNSYFLGGLAEIRVWNRPLSRAEIADLYTSNVVPREGLVAENLLNEGRGTLVHDTVGGNNGIVIGATWKSPSQASV